MYETHEVPGRSRRESVPHCRSIVSVPARNCGGEGIGRGLAEEYQGLFNLCGGVGEVKRRGLRLLAQFFTGLVGNYRDVQVPGRRVAEDALQPLLAGRGV